MRECVVERRLHVQVVSVVVAVVGRVIDVEKENTVLESVVVVVRVARSINAAARHLSKRSKTHAP